MSPVLGRKQNSFSSNVTDGTILLAGPANSILFLVLT